MDMLLLRTIISTVAIIIAANLGLCSCGCARAEYEIDRECCPMCAPGNRVYWPCTADTNTTCVPCPASTYTDEPNGLLSCFPCTMCDPVHRLKVHKACTRSADTVCEPQEGFHCLKLNKESCASAVEHSACKPGQYIKQKGTGFSDTVCADCIDGTYSDGSLMACLPHSVCATMGLTEVKAGTTSSDAECEKVTSAGLIAGVTSIVLVAVIVALLACIIHRKHKAWGSNEGNRVYWPCTADTNTTCVPCPASTYTDEPNGLLSCFPCTVCDPVHRLKVHKACTRSADTVCEPQEGFHCLKLNKESCASAVEHSACKPGQYIKQKGTGFSDTVCADCIDGTYSDGSLMACLPHSVCATMGLTEVKAGTTSSDAECEKVTSAGLIAGVTSIVLVAVIVALLACIIHRKHKAWGSNEGVWHRPQQSPEDP